ncbi:MAG: MFS transporter, partial [Eggerthellaceae bacterium]|nr:MFS transporter [Eggerthellaceae bacterium]
MRMHRKPRPAHAAADAGQAQITESPEPIDATSSTRGQSKGYVIVAVIYLLGLCMGALDMGIVNPARTVIQNTLSVDDSLGVWILTIYTLGYAASIPIMGKLADRHGRKYIYLACITLFGGGSALCGLAHDIGSFELLICARAIQALGGGGIMPVATAEFGTAFPEEKRGMALGLVGMVYGLASIFGSSAGSLILDIFGQTQWQFIFYVNIPICIIIFALGIFKLPNRKTDSVPPIDILGAFILTVMTLSLMYGLKNIDFFDLENSVSSTDVYPFLIAFAVLLPAFLLAERRAKDPVINLSYFSNPNILIALVCSVISGIVMMGTIFYPQFAENSLFLKSGAGGYFIMILGLGSGFGAMLSGK